MHVDNNVYESSMATRQPNSFVSVYILAVAARRRGYAVTKWMQWAVYGREVADETLRRRREHLRSAVRSFGLRESYVFRDEVLAALRPGRTSVLRWEACRSAIVSRWREVEDKSFSSDQVRYIDESRNALLIKLYGGFQKVQADFVWLNHTLHATITRDSLAIIQPRRQGKTLTASFISTVTYLTQDDGNVATFCPLFNQAAEWLSAFRRWADLVRKDAYFGWSVEVEQSGKRLTARKRSTDRTVTLTTHGSGTQERAAQGLRGVAPNVMLVNIDEFFFLVGAAYKVIIPAAANGATILATSSNPARANIGADLLEAVYPDSGRKIFRVLDWRPRCEGCKRIEMEQNIKVECRHLGIVQAPDNDVRSVTDQLRQKGLLEPLQAYDTEMLNAPPEGQAMPLFEPEHVEEAFGLHQTPLDLGRATQTHIFVSCDPGSAVERSDTAIVTGTFVYGGDSLTEVDAAENRFDTHLVVRVACFPYRCASPDSPFSPLSLLSTPLRRLQRAQCGRVSFIRSRTRRSQRSCELL